MLVTALKDSRWFIPLERQGLQNLLNERKIIRAAQENGTVAINNRIPLQSLTAANIMVEGSIIGYESNVKSGGVGARYFGIRHAIPARSDCREPACRHVSTGEILSSVNTSKTILSYEVQAGFSALFHDAALAGRGSGLHLKRTRYAVFDVGYRNRGHFPD
ncbi:CsgG/HfaB family protein [Escherichia coli]